MKGNPRRNGNHEDSAHGRCRCPSGAREEVGKRGEVQELAPSSFGLWMLPIRTRERKRELRVGFIPPTAPPPQQSNSVRTARRRHDSRQRRKSGRCLARRCNYVQRWLSLASAELRKARA
ncbi:hypothetical protein MRX96_026303 [Rhipicephalus microplus]